MTTDHEATEATEDVATPEDQRVCDCGATPDPSESPTAGDYTENGIEKYICLRCWARENGSDGGVIPS